MPSGEGSMMFFELNVTVYCEVALGAGRQHKPHMAIRAGYRHVRRRGERQAEAE